MIKLGTMVADKVTGMKGMLTNYNIDIGGNVNYVFQPAGLNPKTMEPKETFWITADRVVDGELITVNLPTEILGTEVEEIATGFKGTAISLYCHINGCVHIEIKPKGTIAETGDSIRSHQFDIRRLKGEAIKKLTEGEKEKSQKTNPSPVSTPKLFNR